MPKRPNTIRSGLESIAEAAKIQKINIKGKPGLVDPYFNKKDQALLKSQEYKANFDKTMSKVRPDILVYIENTRAHRKAFRSFSDPSNRYSSKDTPKIDEFAGTFSQLRKRLGTVVKDPSIIKTILGSIEPAFGEKVINFVFRRKKIWLLITNNDPKADSHFPLTPNMVLHRLGHALASDGKNFDAFKDAVFKNNINMLPVECFKRRAFAKMNVMRLEPEADELAIELFIQFLITGKITFLRKFHDEIDIDRYQRELQSHNLPTTLSSIHKRLLKFEKNKDRLERELTDAAQVLLNSMYGKVFIG
jgi:hypothetical protein